MSLYGRGRIMVIPAYLTERLEKIIHKISAEPCRPGRCESMEIFIDSTADFCFCKRHRHISWEAIKQLVTEINTDQKGV